ncbi:MAG: hypothetical protein CR975_07415 [Gammaproteobacteria bacterium]|nr:MAG: hypothetical protein CR975_07415 [Gammaproteobacteria bacterium]
MKKKSLLFATVLGLSTWAQAQNLCQGLPVNDLAPHPMQPLAKPAVYQTVTDPSFGTTIRRISNAAPGEVIKPHYSTIQAWNADESLMILYRAGGPNGSAHLLLDGRTYQPIRTLDDIAPKDLEQIFWDWDEPNILYYPETGTENFIKYTVSTQNKQILFNMRAVSGCSGSIALGNDVQMLSRDADHVQFRCGNETAYSYQISTQQLTTFAIAPNPLNWVAPAIGYNGQRFYHNTKVYNTDGSLALSLNEHKTEHHSMGQLSNGHDGLLSVAFAEGPQGGCLGNIVAHDLETGSCFNIISQEQDYAYPKTGTHMSGLAYKNSEPGWLAASMIGYQEDGQALLDQELVIAKADPNNPIVCRIGHHRSDENEFDYWGEPHATISPSGTRVLFASDWSGSEDGRSVDAYVVELPAYQNTTESVLFADSFEQ